MPDETLDELINLNLTSVIRTCKAAIPWMLERGGGDIVNVCSIASIHPFGQAGAYVSAKAGLLGFTKSLSSEYRSQGIRVAAVLPGSTDTPLWDSQTFSPDRKEMLSPEAVAEAIRDVVLAPRDRSFDEIVLMPPKGIL
jgi:short-subunit dehydrogenase